MNEPRSVALHHAMIRIDYLKNETVIHLACYSNHESTSYEALVGKDGGT